MFYIILLEIPRAFPPFERFRRLWPCAVDLDGSFVAFAVSDGKCRNYCPFLGNYPQLYIQIVLGFAFPVLASLQGEAIQPHFPVLGFAIPVIASLQGEAIHTYCEKKIHAKEQEPNIPNKFLLLLQRR
jgi:hypothetical protein